MEEYNLFCPSCNKIHRRTWTIPYSVIIFDPINKEYVYMTGGRGMRGPEKTRYTKCIDKAKIYVTPSPKLAQQLTEIGRQVQILKLIDLHDKGTA